jgi:class 3 adenylate cyclase
MHRQFHQALSTARGDAQLVIAAFVDIRGFSVFNETVESVQSALYIRKVYQRMLDDYFSFASFFKPTGDGLMIIVNFEEDTLERVSNDVVDRSVTLVNDFGRLTQADRVINFRVPDRLGIGVARGAACRLYTGDQTLDYSGRTLNLAARLMDLARPQGIVIDDSFGIDLLTDDLRKSFATEEVYIRGIAPTKPLSIHYTKDWTSIPSGSKRRLDAPDLKEVAIDLSLAQLEQRGPAYMFNLPSEPVNPDEMVLRVAYPAVDSHGLRKKGDIFTFITFDETKFQREGNRPVARVHVAKLVEELKANGVKKTWPIKLYFRYQEI